MRFDGPPSVTGVEQCCDKGPAATELPQNKPVEYPVSYVGVHGAGASSHFKPEIGVNEAYGLFGELLADICKEVTAEMSNLMTNGRFGATDDFPDKVL